MIAVSPSHRLAWLGPLGGVALLLGGVAAAAPLDFNRDIRPILSENCFQCHGQDPAKREAKLRLDERESATQLRDGYAAILPGRPAESEVIRRIASNDPTEVMPPPESHKRVTPAQAALLRQWISEGARYAPHWAFIPPQSPALPEVRRATWSRSGLDRFVLARLEREGLAPAAEAAPGRWLRRAAFDLTGLPPTPAELDAFAADVARRGEAAYAAAADRLLASPHYGERQALEWLDAARYADTHGFNNDSSRSMWRWRDWVIDAFNSNLPYDRFLTEQIAGDLLPQPTLEQRIATGFARNHVINSEGGIIDEEYRVEYVADRVRTLSTAWLGLTMECARCHDHKFDPVTQKDYYRLFAFFNHVPEHGEDGRVANAIPMLAAPDRAQQAALATQQHELAALDAKLAGARAAWRRQPGQRERIRTVLGTALRATAGREEEAVEAFAGLPLFAAAGSGTAGDRESGAVAGGEGTAAGPLPTVPAGALDWAGKEGVSVLLWVRPAADNPRDVALLSALNHLGSPADSTFGRGREVRLIDGEIEVRFSERFPAYAIVARTEGARLRPGERRHVALTYAGGKTAAALRIYVDGEEVAVRVAYDGLPGEPPKRELLVGGDNAKDGARFRGELEDGRGFARALTAPVVRAHFQLGALVRVSARLDAGAPLSERESQWLRDALLADDAATAELVAERDARWAAHLALRRSLPTVMVMTERAQPRPTFVLNRGQYDAPGDAVEPGVPEALLGAWPKDAPRNRLGLAQWLTRPDHPLTARVVVNRLWAQLFGTGIVKTLEDFGSQSEWPSHPELLDWLARRFVDGGWDLKALLRLMVLSSTYRQDSAVTPELLARDPENRLLARGPRVRLPAELIRDQALAVSGLLTRRIGGPSVYPYQPDKLYEGIVVGAEYPGTKWLTSAGGDLYRRSLYTFWKRTMPHPAMTAFDAPDREFCTVRRSRTNTPLQALVLWNEPGYLEAARHLATRIWREGGADDAARLALAFQHVTGRRPSAEEGRVLLGSLAKLRADFAAHPDEAARFLAVGASPVEAGLPPVELAAAMGVASMMLSLDETVTKN